MTLDAKRRAEGRSGRPDRLDVRAERIALMLGPDRVLTRRRYVGEPAATGTGDHGCIPIDKAYATPGRGLRGFQSRYAKIRRMMRRDRSRSPEWTNFNRSDPGVTLLELFSYLAEELAYYQGKVAAEARLATRRRRVLLLGAGSVLLVLCRRCRKGRRND